MRIKVKIILFLIFILGFVLRFWHLADFPEGVHIDEASRGYNAYSILKTGRDEYGKKFPIFFEAEGEYKTPVGVYTSVLHYAVFGFSKITDRWLSAFVGVLEIIFFYLLFCEIASNRKWSLMGAFLYAISYWTINFVRNADTNQLTLLSIVIFAYFLVKFLKDNSYKFLILTFVFALSAVFSCRTSVVFVPIFLFMIFIIYFRKIKKRKFSFLFFYLLLILSILISSRFIIQRFNSSGVNAFPEMESVLQEQIREDGRLASVWTTRFFHNKITGWAQLIGKKYTENLDPGFIFFRADQSLNNGVSGEPMFFNFEFLLFIIGLIYIIRHFHENEFNWIPVLFILAAPVPNSVVIDSPSASRMLIGSFGIFFIIVAGFRSTAKINLFVAKRIIWLSIVVLYAYYFSHITHAYYVHKPVHHAWYRNHSLEDLVGDLEKLRTQYRKVYFGENFITQYLFISRYDPVLLQERILKFPNYSVANRSMKILYDNYDNFKCDDFKNGDPDSLYVCVGRQVPKKSKIIKVYRFRDSQPSYILIQSSSQEIQQLPDKVEFLPQV